MFKDKTENVEVYFICYKKEGMNLVESYYDEVLNIHNWYFNSYLAYQHWKKGFRTLHIKGVSKMLLVVAASRYLIYAIENQEYKNEKEYQKLIKDLAKIQKELKKIENLEPILKEL